MQTQINESSQTQTPHLVIIGAGFAGLKTAQKLKDAPLRITIIDKKNHHLFQPLLYQVATAGLSPADIAVPIRSILRFQTNTEVIMGTVIGIDKNNKKVLMSDYNIDYDFLVLATGAQHSYFGHQDWEEHAPGLKSIEDATNIRKNILTAFERAEIEKNPDKQQSLLTFVLVGAGPTGVEMAGAIAELAHVTLARDFRHINPHKTHILLLEAGPRILKHFPDALAQFAHHKLQSLGVDICTNTTVEKITDNQLLASGKTIRASNIIWTAGVKASPAGEWLQTPTDAAGRVIVNHTLNIPEHSEIYVIGDTALVLDENKNPLPGIAPVALQQGLYVAREIHARLKDLTHQSPKFRYYDKGNLATIGRSSAIAEIKKYKLTGFIAWVIWTVVHIFYLIGFRSRIIVMLEWAWSYLTFQKGSRLIVGTEPNNQIKND